MLVVRLLDLGSLTYRKAVFQNLGQYVEGWLLLCCFTAQLKNAKPGTSQKPMWMPSGYAAVCLLYVFYGAHRPSLCYISSGCSALTLLVLALETLRWSGHLNDTAFHSLNELCPRTQTSAYFSETIVLKVSVLGLQSPLSPLKSIQIWAKKTILLNLKNSSNHFLQSFHEQADIPRKHCGF